MPQPLGFSASSKLYCRLSVFDKHSRLAMPAVTGNSLIRRYLADVTTTGRAGLAALPVHFQKVTNLDVDIVTHSAS